MNISTLKPLAWHEIMTDYARHYHSEMVQGGKSAPHIVMPARLTAENGAKALLIGEFSEEIRMICPECYGNGEDHGDPCDLCDGLGNSTAEVNVSWDNIKQIYARAVEAFGKPQKA